jgi:2-polyprenyl-3-methyl-5-hydroxy-6-metoxy-1,4-benzoquinol methylase
MAPPSDDSRSPLPEGSLQGADQAVKRVLKSAESFAQRHGQDTAISLTYRYFTSHPVAPLNQRRLRALLEASGQRAAELKRPLRILDLACGGGIITCALASMGHRALGVDLNASEIRMARMFAQEEKLDGMFLQTDLLKDAGWERSAQETLGGKPDIVTLAYALHHLPEITPFLKRLENWLEAPTQLLINEENPESPLFRLKHRVRTWLQKDTDTEWHRSFTEWKRLIETHGFKVSSQITGLDMLPGMARVKPDKCWSIVFTAQRG